MGKVRAREPVDESPSSRSLRGAVRIEGVSLRRLVITLGCVLMPNLKNIRFYTWKGYLCERFWIWANCGLMRRLGSEAEGPSSRFLSDAKRATPHALKS